MIIGILYLDLHLPESDSLKAKRRIIKGLKERLRGKFNISVSELDQTDKWQRTGLGVSLISNDTTLAHSILEKVIQEVFVYRGVLLLEASKQFL
ncbi:MAG: DUF503 domain-containing protein [Candidatus Omnitrophica bacterium]|nr:DUF503 domain-containing protein [Candidatus Omnitrophota bacterium]